MRHERRTPRRELGGDFDAAVRVDALEDSEADAVRENQGAFDLDGDGRRSQRGRTAPAGVA